MKLLRIKLIDGESLGILRGFELSLAPTSGEGTEPSCFVGKNGTGKSRVLQCVAEIFYWLDARTRLFRPDPGAEIGFRFELEYEVLSSRGLQHITVRNIQERQQPEVLELLADGAENRIIDSSDIRAILPRFVIGYTSGENETLSVPFLDVRQEYATEIRDLALVQRRKQEDVPDLRLVMMDYHSNFAILAANFLLQPTDRLKLLREYTRIEGLDSFRIVVQLNHRAVNRKLTVKVEQPNGRFVERRTTGVQLVAQLDAYIQQLQRCATCFKYDSTERRWTFDFFVTEETRKAFRHFFAEAHSLFLAFQRLAMLNDLLVRKKDRTRIDKIRRKQKLVVKMPTPAEEDKVFRFESVWLSLTDTKDAVEYINLSDGEHQFVHIFGTLLMFAQNNVLFLFDEPESHFNPQWRIEFGTLVNAIAHGEHQCILLTSHAPFVISDCKADHVYIFRRKPDGRSVEAVSPNTETYGASFDRLLSQVFEITPPPVARKSLHELRKLQKTGTAEQIESRLADFGDSPEKFFLFEKLERLKSGS